MITVQEYLSASPERVPARLDKDCRVPASPVTTIFNCPDHLLFDLSHNSPLIIGNTRQHGGDPQRKLYIVKIVKVSWNVKHDGSPSL
jgi:hypothetical protein